MQDKIETHRSHLLIGGQWQSQQSAVASEDVVNAADGSLLGRVPVGTIEDVDRAVAAARRATAEWRLTAPAERAAALRALRDALAPRADEIARIICQEVGTPISIAERLQVELPLKVLESYAAAVEELEWKQTVGNSIVVREAAGVVAAITPWNYPLYQLVVKVGAALAAGCTVVAKPANVAPLSAFVLADAVLEAGLPDGVVNLVSGRGRTVGEAIATHPGIDMISFTGSTVAGARVAELAARNVTRVVLELGGKSPTIILDDADLARAVRSGVGNAFLNSGQTCTATTRMLVPRHLHDEAIDLARAAADRLVVGHPLDPATRLGPLASAQQREQVLEYIQLGSQEGARLVYGGGECPAGLETGFYVSPTIFADVDNGARIAQEEIFGPILAIIPYDGQDEAVRMGNDTEYGLVAAVWSADEECALAVAGRLRTGQVDINGAAFNPAAPFGGYKRSGIGRELGTFGIEEFCELKSIQR